MKLQDLTKQVLKSVQANKKISKVDVVEADLKKYLATIDAVNALPHDEVVLNGKPVSSYKIPKGWEGLIYPHKLSLGGHRRNPDLLIRPEEVTDFTTIMNPSDFNDLTDTLLGTARNQGNDTPIERPIAKRLDVDGEWLVDGMYINNEVKIGMYDLQSERIDQVLFINNHCENIDGDFARQMAKALSGNHDTFNNSDK